MFTALIVKPLFNLLTIIYALLPGHNFGLALIIFTIIIRLLLWPLLKKQLHQTKAMRLLQPDIKRIKAATKGNRQQESLMLMELYKEKGINPLATFPILILNLIVLLGLYSGIRRVVNDPHTLVTFAYPFVQNLSWIHSLSINIHLFDNTLFGVIHLGQSAIGKAGVYWPALLLVAGSALAQFYQAKQLMPTSKDQRGLKAILKDAGRGKQADQSEINAAVGSSTKYMIPMMVFLFTISLPAALSLYWLTGGIVAIIQQGIVLGKDETEMEAIADKPSRDLKSIPEAEVVTTPNKQPIKTSNKNKKNKKRKRWTMHPINESMEEAIQYGKKYIEDLLSFFGLNTDVYATSDDEVIQLSVPSTHMNGFLIGHNGENMRSLQYLTSTALKNNYFEHTRVNVDIADYKKQRAERLREHAVEWVKHVRDSGIPMDLEPMNAADRRVVHQLAAEYSLTSDSIGDGRDRHIILKTAGDQAPAPAEAETTETIPEAVAEPEKE